MKSLILFLAICFFPQSEMLAQTDFVLEPSQSMIMTGKGTGQDATINPYYGQDCFAVTPLAAPMQNTVMKKQKASRLLMIKRF